MCAHKEVEDDRWKAQVASSVRAALLRLPSFMNTYVDRSSNAFFKSRAVAEKRIGAVSCVRNRRVKDPAVAEHVIFWISLTLTWIQGHG